MDPTDQPPLDGDGSSGAALLLHAATGSWRPVALRVDRAALRIADGESERIELDVPIDAVVAVDAIGGPGADGTEIEISFDRYPPLGLRLPDPVLDHLLAALDAAVGRPSSDRPDDGADVRARRWVALTAPRVWVAFIVLCVTVSAGAFLGSALSRRTGDGTATADSLATWGAVFLGATACALVGFAFSSARTADGGRSRGDGVQGALFASGVLLVGAVVLSAILVSERVEPDLSLHTGTTAPRDAPGTPGDGGGSGPTCAGTPPAASC